MQHKLIISGTGRAGTTMLVQLLTQLGLDTGFQSPNEDIDSRARAGMEWDLADPGAPYILKSSWLCVTLEEHIKSGRFAIDHALVPVRDLKVAAASRVEVSEAAGEIGSPSCGTIEGVRGGMWCTSEPSRQAVVLARLFYDLIRVLTVYDIPHTFLDFPRFTRDSDYLYGKLAPVIGTFDGRAFQQAFAQVARPELVRSRP